MFSVSRGALTPSQASAAQRMMQMDMDGRVQKIERCRTLTQQGDGPEYLLRLAACPEFEEYRGYNVVIARCKSEPLACSLSVSLSPCRSHICFCFSFCLFLSLARALSLSLSRPCTKLTSCNTALHLLA